VTALDYLIASAAYIAIGLAVLFVVLPFGLWIGKVMIIAGLEKVTE
jgi:predicted secreted protein